MVAYSVSNSFAKLDCDSLSDCGSSYSPWLSANDIDVFVLGLTLLKDVLGYLGSLSTTSVT